MESILQIDNLTIRFGGLVAVNNVSINHTGKEIVSIIGPNGAGKTTLFNLLTGSYHPNEGKIIFRGEDITYMKPHQRVRAGIARTFQNIRLFPELTVLENVLVCHPGCRGESLIDVLIMGKRALARRRHVIEECETILKEVNLLQYENSLATSLPYGKQRLLEIARAMATSPTLLLLDEPGAGMNLEEKEELLDLIHYINLKKNINILLIEHDMKFVMNISERIIVLDHGEKIAEGNALQIQSNQAVVEAYLGKGNADFGEQEEGLC